MVVLYPQWSIPRTVGRSWYQQSQWSIPRTVGRSWYPQWSRRWRSWSRWYWCRGRWRHSPWPRRQSQTRTRAWILERKKRSAKWKQCRGFIWRINHLSPAQKPSPSAGRWVMYCQPWRLVWLQKACNHGWPCSAASNRPLTKLVSILPPAPRPHLVGKTSLQPQTSTI